MTPLFCDPLKAEKHDIAFETLEPLRAISPRSRRCRHYYGLRSDILIHGTNNAIYVVPCPGKNGKFSVLDGHIRCDILKRAGHTHVQCINLQSGADMTDISQDCAHLLLHESQILHNAMRKGISPNTLAEFLPISPKEIVFRGNAIVAICVEAQDMLLRKPVAFKALKILRLVKKERQVEMVNAMIKAAVYSHVFAIYLMSQTPIDQIIGNRRKYEKHLNNKQLADCARNVAPIGRAFESALQTHRTDMLNLSLISAYISMMMKNADYIRYLARQHPGILKNFEDLLSFTSTPKGLEEDSSAAF